MVRVLTLLALFPMLIGAWGAFEQHRRIASWKPISAQVVRSEESPSGTGKGARPGIRYRYFAGGTEYESERVYPGPIAAPASLDLLERYPLGAETTVWHDSQNPAQAFLVPEHGFLSYFIFMFGSPLLALAAGVATGGIRYIRSSEREVPPPRENRDGWWEVEPIRRWLQLRNSSAAALAAFGTSGLIGFGHYFGVEPHPSVSSVLLFAVWLLLVFNLLWGVFARTLVGRKLDDARLLVRPAVPQAGSVFHVAVEQIARMNIRARMLQATLVAQQTVRKSPGRRGRRTKIVFRANAILAKDITAIAGMPLRGEHAFPISNETEAGDGFIHWRVEVRTSLLGPDYRTRFPLASPEEYEE